MSDLLVKAADFVICGGGTAGLVLAARLSEIPTVTVAVLEAGGDYSHDVNVLAPGLLTTLYGDPKYDWIYTTVPQVHSDGTVISYPRGKQLGGSSAINYLAWTHASPLNIDNWGYLGNEGWSWSELEPYYTKSENFSIPNATVVADLDLHWLNDSAHGHSGPIRNAYPHQWTPLDEAWPRTFDNLGIGMMNDERDGVALGGYNIQTNLNLDNNTRSYAATSYLNPIRYRDNLMVYTFALVTKVNFEDENGTSTASSVTFMVNGTEYTIGANQEVIVSGGAFGSPHILELSGIGNSELLDTYNITVVYDNSNVGENLQDHILLNLGFPVFSDIFTTDNLTDPSVYNASLAEYEANHTGPLAEVALGGGYLSAQQIIPDEQQLAEFLNNVTASAQSINNTQSKLIAQGLNDGQELSQLLNIVGSVNPLNANAAPPISDHGFTIQVCAEHMLSRGSVHVSSSNASVYSTVNPNFFDVPVDVQMLSFMALYAQNVIAQTPPLSDYLVGNGTTLQSQYTNLTKANVDDIIKREIQTVDHPCGSCSMLPEADGGVVDARFRVYGVQNLRVVDASIIPLIPRGNLQTCVYAIAERAADFIKQDHGFPSDT